MGNQGQTTISCWVSWSNYLCANMKGDRMVLAGKVSGSSVTYDTNTSATSDEDTWYDVRVLCDGGNRGDKRKQSVETGTVPHEASPPPLTMEMDGP